VVAGTNQSYTVRRRSTRRAWIAFTIPLLLLALRAIFEFAFDGLTGRIVSGLDRATDGSVPLMAIAGSLTIAFVPLAACVFASDRRSRLGAAGSDVVHMTTRVRSDSGHRIAPRPVAYWLRRAPLLLASVVAVLFWPLTGASMASRWMTTPGGVAFSVGWRVGLVAAAVGVVILLAEPWIGAALSRVRMVRLVAIVLPALAFSVALIIR
jgi:hypothetical protein